MGKRCPECGYPLDPWGGCIRCTKPDEEKAIKKAEKIRVIALRELVSKTPIQVAHELSGRFPAMSIDVAQKLNQQVKRRKRKKKD